MMILWAEDLGDNDDEGNDNDNDNDDDDDEGNDDDDDEREEEGSGVQWRLKWAGEPEISLHPIDFLPLKCTWIHSTFHYKCILHFIIQYTHIQYLVITNLFISSISL